MKVVGQQVLSDFARKHADSISRINSWICEVEEADWRSPKDIKSRYPHASILAENRVVFNLKGNSYRLDVKVNYDMRVMLVKRIGTHAEYSKWKF